MPQFTMIHMAISFYFLQKMRKLHDWVEIWFLTEFLKIQGASSGRHSGADTRAGSGGVDALNIRLQGLLNPQAKTS